MPERLLDDQPDPTLGAAPRGDLCDERPDRARRDREVVDAVSLRAQVRVERRERVAQLVLGLVVGEVERHVVHAFGEPLPRFVFERVARVILDRLLHPFLERVVGLLGARGADDPETLGQQAADRERVQRRQQLLRRQVAGRAEDDEDARVGPTANPQAVEQRVLLGRRGHDGRSGWTACPPNWLRSAALTLAANDSSWRDANRAKSAAVITGTGTSSAIASAIVQRPSPESST